MVDVTALSMCTMCRRRGPIYARPYSGEKLCRKCFTHSIEKKVKSTISEYDMLRFDDKIALGVSGGKDSMTLLNIMMKLEKSFPKAMLTAITIDEGIAGYREEALEIAEEECKDLGVEHVVFSFKELFGYTLDKLLAKIYESELSKDGLTPCAYCGVLRRRALNLAARHVQAKKLAVAHNLDDEAQTVLLNIFHGNPRRILKIKPASTYQHPSFVCRIKPLCLVPERELTFYAYLKGIMFQRTPCPYAFKALRNDVRTMLNRMEKKHPGLKYTVYRSAEKLRSTTVTTSPINILGVCKTCGEPSSSEICQPCEMLARALQTKN